MKHAYSLTDGVLAEVLFFARLCSAVEEKLIGFEEEAFAKISEGKLLRSIDKEALRDSDKVHEIFVTALSKRSSEELVDLITVMYMGRDEEDVDMTLPSEERFKKFRDSLEQEGIFSGTKEDLVRIITGKVTFYEDFMHGEEIMKK